MGINAFTELVVVNQYKRCIQLIGKHFFKMQIF
jgi:hypothetical protein